jgi:excisionase family DNA binding protein
MDSPHTPVGDADRLMTGTEVAALFRVVPRTVMKWRKAGRLVGVRTPGGHLRYREAEVRALLEGHTGDADN